MNGDSTVSPSELFPNTTAETDAEDQGPRVDSQFEEFADQEGGAEMQAPKWIRDLSQPSQRERAEHDLSGHAVFRNWCRHCMRGRCRE